MWDEKLQKLCIALSHCNKKKTIHATCFLAISCDEVMTIDNQSWVNIHACFMDSLKCIPILLYLKRLVSDDTFDNLTNVILNSLLVHGGLILQEINDKQIYCGSYGVVVFINVHSGMTTQIYKKVIPFMLVVHYIAHWTNLIMQTYCK